MRRVLFAVHTYEPQVNGVQFVTQYMAEGLVGKGYNVTVITNKVDGAPENEIINGVWVTRIRIDGRNNHKFIGDKKAYYRIIDNFKPDVLVAVCTQSWPFDWIVSKLNELKCIKILYTHGYSEYKDKYGIIEKLKQGRLLTAKYMFGSKLYYMKAAHYIKMFDKVVYITKDEEAYHFAKKHNFTNELVISNAVDDRFWNLRSRDATDETVRILNVGNYGDVKDQRRLLELVYQLKEQDILVNFVGSEVNEYYQKLLIRKKELDQEFGERNIIFHTGLKREKVIELFTNSDIYAMSSRREAFSISLCEAAASGLPIISTPTGNVSEFDGIIVAHDDEEYIRSLDMLCLSKSEREKRGNNLRTFAFKNCRIEDKVAKFENTIRELLNGREYEV